MFNIYYSEKGGKIQGMIIPAKTAKEAMTKANAMLRLHNKEFKIHAVKDVAININQLNL